jgi:protein-disulfide isomerase
MVRGLKAAAAALALSAALVAPQAANALDEAQKQEFGAFIREYLMANPEIIEEVQQALAAKREAEAADKAKTAIADNADRIFRAETDIVLGNPAGDVTVVEFFDYNCGYCKRALSDMNQILEKDPKVRFVLKEFPILGPDSLAVHRVAMSLRKLMPEKYQEFHITLLTSEARATEATAVALATSLGADEAALRAGMDDPAINEEIRDTYDLADKLGINGTPSYVVGNETVFGAMGADVIAEKVANFRTCQSTVC